MKKIIVLALVLLFSSVALSFADTGAPTVADAGKELYAGVAAVPTGSSDGTLIGKLSKGVYVGWNTGAGGYAVTTQHLDGNRSFGSSWDATAIYRNDTKETAAPDDTTKGYFASGWSAM